MPRNPTTVARKVAVAATFLALAGALSACQKTEAQLTVSQDDRVTGELVIMLSDEHAWAPLAAMDPDADLDLDEPAEGEPMDLDTYIDTVLANPDTGNNELPASVTVTPYRAGGYSGVKATFDDTSFRQFNTAGSDDGSDPIMTLRRVSTSAVKFTMLVPARLETVTPGSPQPTYKAKLTFPGRVTSTNGRVVGRTVTWNVKPGTKAKTLFAVAASRR